MSKRKDVGLPEGEDGGISRRDALKRGAVIGGAAAFAIPVIGTISMSQASAQTTSGNPNQPPIGGLT